MELQIGPSMFTKEMPARIVGPTEWFENYVRKYNSVLYILFI